MTTAHVLLVTSEGLKDAMIRARAADVDLHVALWANLSADQRTLQLGDFTRLMLDNLWPRLGGDMFYHEGWTAVGDACDEVVQAISGEAEIEKPEREVERWKDRALIESATAEIAMSDRDEALRVLALMVQAEDQASFYGALAAAKELLIRYVSPSGQVCVSCNAAGVFHCSDPENCGGMRDLTVEEAVKAVRKVGVQVAPPLDGRQE